ncbi:MAG: PqqD family protein [Melioribacteraceae bacterium]|jgi:hypothetical protein|nr:HPr-rel-A system PqqD family protein [Ignavibacteriota bacterium]MBZ0182459.1 PqqD family protein [Melioribacteraceae bacterium]
MSNYKVFDNLAVSESGFLFSPSTGESFTLNPIANQILHLLKQGETINQIKEKILSEYDIDESSLEKDLDDFINQLINYKIVEEK